MKLNLTEIEKIKVCLWMVKKDRLNAKSLFKTDIESLYEKFSSFLKEQQSKVNCEINVKTNTKI
jgi:hypothetical protein